MLEFCIYSIVLLLQVFILINGIFISRRVPVKIKSLITIVFGALGLRYISLLILFLSKNIKYLYMLKPFVFLNIFAIPVGAMICFYIFMRNSKINFNYLFVISGLIFTIYVIAIFKYSSLVEMLKNHGYIIGLLNSSVIHWLYLVINTICLLCSMLVMVNKNANKFGLTLIIISSIVVIVETLNVFVQYVLFPNNILGDIVWTITIVYAINKVKK